MPVSHCKNQSWLSFMSVSHCENQSWLSFMSVSHCENKHWLCTDASVAPREQQWQLYMYHVLHGSWSLAVEAEGGLGGAKQPPNRFSNLLKCNVYTYIYMYMKQRWIPPSVRPFWTGNCFSTDFSCILHLLYRFEGTNKRHGLICCWRTRFFSLRNKCVLRLNIYCYTSCLCFKLTCDHTQPCHYFSGRVRTGWGGWSERDFWQPRPSCDLSDF